MTGQTGGEGAREERCEAGSGLMVLSIGSYPVAAIARKTVLKALDSTSNPAKKMPVGAGAGL